MDEPVYAFEDGERVAYVEVFGRLTRIVLDDPDGDDGFVGVRGPRTPGPGRRDARTAYSSPEGPPDPDTVGPGVSAEEVRLATDAEFWARVAKAAKEDSVTVPDELL